MASRQPFVATTFVWLLGLGALAVAIVAIALSLTAAAAGRADEAERNYAAVNLLENRHAVTSLLAAEEAAAVMDVISGGDTLAAAPLTAQRSTAVEAATKSASVIGDRIDTVGAEAQRWVKGLTSNPDPAMIEDPFDRLIGYANVVEASCCGGIVPSDEHHSELLLELEAAALIPRATWQYLYMNIEGASRRDSGVPAIVSRFLDEQGTPVILPLEDGLPSEQLTTGLGTFASLGVSQEAINTFLSSAPVAALDNVARQAAGQPGVVVTIDEAYAAADAAHRSIDGLFAQAIEQTRDQLMSDMGTADQIRLVTLVVSPLLLVVLAIFGLIAHRFGRNRARMIQREQDLLDARNRFMRMVSHELRTPATAISGFAEMLGDDWTSLTEPEIAEFLAIVNRQSSHLSLMVDDLLTLSHLETGRLRLHLVVVNLKQTAEEAISRVDTRYGIEVDATIDPSITLVADPDRLGQILRNLVENAAKYGKTGVSVSAAVVGTGCEIVVSDTGPPVPGELAGRIFRFWDRTAKDGSRARGYGMGLAIARHLAQAMVGDLIYRPRDPIGNEFVLSLPLGPPDALGLSAHKESATTSA